MVLGYIGSKHSLIKFIDEHISLCIDDNISWDNITFVDLFAGTSSVGFNYRKKGCRVISNDIEYYSYVISKGYIEGNYNETMQDCIDELNNIDINEYQNNGIITNYYTIDGKYSDTNSGNRNFFKPSNAIKTDIMRMKIEEWFKEEYINENEYYFLLASLIETLDSLANTIGVYGAFLKDKMKPSADKDIILTPLHTETEHNKFNVVFNKDVLNIERDDIILNKNPTEYILYADPPYNQRQYSSNYHILNVIAHYDIEKFPIRQDTTAGLLVNKNTSDYCKKRDVTSAFESLLQNITKWNINNFYMSYNDEGLMSLDIIKNLMTKYGDNYHIYEKDYARYKCNNNKQKQKQTIEYLHYIKF
jgi:adenine-specific DNA-methyltransferase